MKRRWWWFFGLVFLFLCLIVWRLALEKETIPSIDSKEEPVQVKVAEKPVPELSFLLETLKLNQSLGHLPTSLNQYDQELLKLLIDQEQKRTEEQSIPETARSLYESKESVLEIKNLIRSIRKEYLDLIVSKKVANHYVEAINTSILSDEELRMNYFSNNGSAILGSTNTHTYDQASRGDWSQLQMDVYSWNIYRYAKQFESSQVLGGVDENNYRDMAIRYIVFHEMTHVLQQAVDVVNAPLDMKKSLLPWINSTRRILAIDERYYQEWGSQTDQLTRDINNMTIAKESQAEGIAFQLLGEFYHLSLNQQQLIWEYHFGELRNGIKELEEINRLVEQIYPEFSLEYVIHQLRGLLKLESQSGIGRLMDRLEGMMATHIGYLHPMLPADTYLFWEYLKK